MRSADYKSLNLSQRSIHRRLDDMAEDIALLSALIQMFIADPVGTRQTLMDASKNPQTQLIGAVPVNYQNQWLKNINHDKLLRLIAQRQRRDRNVAATKITKQDIETAFVADRKSVV